MRPQGLVELGRGRDVELSRHRDHGGGGRGDDDREPEQRIAVSGRGTDEGTTFGARAGHGYLSIHRSGSAAVGSTASWVLPITHRRDLSNTPGVTQARRSLGGTMVRKELDEATGALEALSAALEET